jgi:Uma2 family endonuclease
MALHSAIVNRQRLASSASGQEAGQVRQLDLDEYQTLIEHGFFRPEERVELVQGYLIAMSPINPPHAGTLTRLATAFTLRLNKRAIVRTQSPIVLPGLKSQPEPDLVLAQPRSDGYDRRHPSPEEILLVVEISDSTLKYDQEEKKRQYAAAGIVEYWLFNLIDLLVEVYRQPFVSETGEADFQSKTVYRPGQRIAPALFPKTWIRLEDIFPRHDNA